MKKLFLFFIDGIGLCQKESPLSNLFSKITGKNLIAGNQPDFFDSGVICSADATLNVSGTPQSATGQVAIFTGVNASEYLGYHLTAFPNQKLVELIEKQSLMKGLAEQGISVTSANMYSKEFFQKRAAKRRNAFPVSTLTIKASGAAFRYFTDYEKGEAVFADITNRLIRERGYDIEEITPETAAVNLLNILEDNEFVFFEYFMTDVYGHKRNKEKLEECVDILNRFTETVWSGLKNKNTAILIISDHGNAEDLSTGDHTYNNVPAILLTRNKAEAAGFAVSIHSLVDIYPWVFGYFLENTDIPE
jgi:2,3-bisphosphoglycerate-independent phosphoglycerate mutase